MEFEITKFINQIPFVTKTRIDSNIKTGRLGKGIIHDNNIVCVESTDQKCPACLLGIPSKTFLFLYCDKKLNPITSDIVLDDSVLLDLTIPLVFCKGYNNPYNLKSYMHLKYYPVFAMSGAQKAMEYFTKEFTKIS